MENNIPENNKQGEKVENPKAYDPNSIFENVHFYQENDKNKKIIVSEPPMVMEKRFDKVGTFAFILIVLVILGVGGFFFFQYREKEAMQFEIGVEMTCATLTLRVDLEKAFDPNQTLAQAQPNMMDLRAKMLQKMQPVQKKYGLSSSQLETEIQAVGDRGETDDAFGKKVADEVMRRNCWGIN